MKFPRAGLSASFQHLSLAGKTRLLFAALAGIALLIAASAWTGLVWLNGKTRDYGKSAEIALIGSRLAGSFARAQSHAQHYAASGDPSELAQSREELTSTRKTIDDLDTRAGASQFGIGARLEGLDQAVVAYETLIGSLPAPEQDESRAAISARLDRVTMGGSDFFVQARSMNDEIDQNLQTTGNSSLWGLGWFIGLITVLGIGAALAAVFAMRFARANVSAPIERITKAMREIVAGKTFGTIPEGDRRDEIGEMSRALDVFKNRSEQIAHLQADAATAARAEVELRAAHILHLTELAGTFEASVGEVVGSVASASSQLQRTAAAMAAAAEQSAVQTGHVSNSLGETSQGVTAAAAASDEFAKSINEISQQAATSAELARAVSGNTTQADAAVSSLSEAAAEIGKVVQLIAEIAQRTNLLAINASIEAARGGEAGRGFAVVASEVKDLARQTSLATDQVARQIKGMQDATGNGVDVIRAIGGQIGRLEEAAVSIAAAVDQQSTAGHELARSIDMAARNADEIAEHIGEVQKTAAATGTTASEVLASADELDRHSTTLRSKAEAFLQCVRQTVEPQLADDPSNAAELQFPPPPARRAAA